MNIRPMAHTVSLPAPPVTSRRGMALTLALAQVAALALALAWISTARLHGQSPGQPTAQISAKAQEFAFTWLQTTCGTGDGGIKIETLSQFGTELEPLFLEALEEGPPEDLKARVARATEQRWSARSELLESGSDFGLSEEDRQAAANVSREDYLNRARRDFILSYRTQAAAGLGYVGTKRALVRLRGLAADEESPLQAPARLALARLQERESSPPSP